MRAALENHWFTGLFGDTHLLFITGKNCSWPQGGWPEPIGYPLCPRFVRLLSEPGDVVRDRPRSSALASAKGNFLACHCRPMAQRWAKLGKTGDRISRQAATASPRQGAIGFDGRVRGAAEVSCACRYSERVGTPAEGVPESGGDHALDGRAGQAKTVSYRFVGDMAAVNIQACPQMGGLCYGSPDMGTQ